jgi:ribonuclease D
MSLGIMARERGIAESGTIKPCALNELVLKETMNKDEAVRCSDWSQSTLTKEQEVYAALDAIKPLDIYFELSKLKNLAAPLARRSNKRN